MYVKIHDYCHIEMPKEDNKTIKYNHGEKSMKSSFIIYADFESWLEKRSTYHNNPEKSSTSKINKHTPPVIPCFHIVHLIQQKICLIVIELKTVLKGFERI